VTTESVTGWLQYTDAAAAPTGIGADSAQVGQAIVAVGYDVCIGSIASIPACPKSLANRTHCDMVEIDPNDPKATDDSTKLHQKGQTGSRLETKSLSAPRQVATGRRR
jgi:hypothetical protein